MDPPLHWASCSAQRPHYETLAQTSYREQLVLSLWRTARPPPSEAKSKVNNVNGYGQLSQEILNVYIEPLG